VAVMFLYQIAVFLQQNTTASLLEIYFNESMRTVYACGGGGGSQQREVDDWADGDDVVFTDTGTLTYHSWATSVLYINWHFLFFGFEASLGNGPTHSSSLLSSSSSQSWRFTLFPAIRYKNRLKIQETPNVNKNNETSSPLRSHFSKNKETINGDYQSARVL